LSKKPKTTAEDDYIQSLLDQEITKTELETFDKTGFELAPKEKPISSTEEPIPKEEVPEISEAPKEEVKEIKKKPKKAKPVEEKVEEKPTEIIQPEEEVIEEIPEEIPEEVVESVEEKEVVVKPKTKKKKPVVTEEITELAVEEIAIEEDQPEELVIEETEPEEVKPTKKKVVKKQKKKTEEDEYLQRLMDAEIPKTELEQFEKPEFEPTVKKGKPCSFHLIF